MAEKKGEKPVKNSLLNLASTGFSLEDFSDARLLVPVSVQEEILKSLPEATAEIDLQSDDVSLDEKPFLVPESTPEIFQAGDTFKPEKEEKSNRDSAFLSIFSKAKDMKDSFQSLTFGSSSSSSSASFEPKLVPTPTQELPIAGPEPVMPVPLPSFPISTNMPMLFTPSEPEPMQLFVPGETQFQPENKESFPAPSEITALEDLSSTPQLIPAIDTLPPATVAAPLLVPGLTTDASSIPGLYTPTPVLQPVPPPQSPVPLISSSDSKPSNTDNWMSSSPTPSAPVLTPVLDAASSAAGKASAPPPSQQGSVNKYRLGGQRLQYAQYPGLLPTAPAVQTPSSMGSMVSQPPPPPTIPPSPMGPPTIMGGDGSTNAAAPPLAPSFTQDYSSTGYVFGEPAPARALNQPIPMQYTPVSYHWFYYKEVEGKGIWKPFSFLDSVALEDAFVNASTGLVGTDGGRYDVNVLQRLRTPVYWEDTPTEVRRCSWFYKGPLDNRFIPYEEDFAQQIETEFESAINTGVWQRRVELGGGEAIILHNSNVIVHFCQAASPDEWGNLPESQLRPRVVKRGVDKTFLIEDGESAQIDHLVFLVHGIGAICDFKFRSIVEAVDDFRSLSTQLLHTHFTNALDKNLVGRIEFLPVCWHKALHGDCGVDRKLKPITLHSIPKLRHFTNDTLLDILFYTSPVYCQRIVDTVGNEINRMFNLFLSRNLDFGGSVSLGGHSLGSLILFDLLTHQPSSIRADAIKDPPKPDETTSESTATTDEGPAGEETTGREMGSQTGSSKMVSYTIGQAGTGQPAIVYPAFDFHPECFFAMGSPTAVFISVRGIDQLGKDFRLPTCENFFNIFHPYDPVAYRMEPLIDPIFDKPPVVIPHHKGRKRFHLEIKDAMFRMGTDFKQTMVDTIKNTWQRVYSLASFGRAEETSKANLEQEIDRVIEDELSKSDENQNEQSQIGLDIPIGNLNGGRRIDYVLQEGPLESFNEYLFALSSHVCYWESEDTMLLIMKEIYKTIGVFPDNLSQHAITAASGGTTTPYSLQSGVTSPSSVPYYPTTDYNPYSGNPGQASGNNYKSAIPMTVPPMSSQPTSQYPSVFYNVSSANSINSILPPVPTNSAKEQQSSFSLQSQSTPYGPHSTSNPQQSAPVNFSGPPPIGGYYGAAPAPQQPGYQNPRVSPFPSQPLGNGSVQASAAPAPVGPPPLTGFVRKS